VWHDDAWKPVLKYMEEELEQDLESSVFDEYNVDDLLRVIEEQKKVARHMKERRKEFKGRLYSVLVLIDDFAETPEFLRNSKPLAKLFINGRHLSISTVVSTQKATLVSPTIRTQATSIFVFRIRNQQDLDLISSEFSALLPTKKDFLDLYRAATNEPYGFLYIDLSARDPERMFFKSLKSRLVP
jgi:DNA helicase HerA-like ATPase